MADNQFALRSRCVARFNTSFALLLRSCCHTWQTLRSDRSPWILTVSLRSQIANLSLWYWLLKWRCPITYMSTHRREIGAVHHWLKTNWKEKTLQTCQTHLICIKIGGWEVGGGWWRGWIRAEASCTLRSVGVSGIHVDARVINRPLDLWGIEQRDGPLTSKDQKCCRLSACGLLILFI